MLSKLTTTSGQIFNRICRSSITGRIPFPGTVPSREVHKLLDEKRQVGGLGPVEVKLDPGKRFVSCKKVKERKKDKGPCSRKKGPTQAACPEAPCRCSNPKELSGPSRVKLDKSNKNRTKPSKKDMRKKKCRDGDCDFMDDD